MNEFFLTLPSNTLQSNTTGNFVTHLPKNLVFSGQWEVALSEIQYPFSWNNITGQLLVDNRTDNWIDIQFTNG